MKNKALSTPHIHELINKYQKITSLKRSGQPPIENLVFEGGGIKGLAYVGAIEVLEKNSVLSGVKRVAGSSAGGITALLLSLGCSAEEIKSIMTNEIDFSQLMDRRVSWDPTRLLNAAGMKVGLSDFIMLFKNKGLYKGDSFYVLSKKIVREKLTKHVRFHINDQFEDDLIRLTDEEKEFFIQSKIKDFFSDYYIGDPGNITFGQFENIKKDFPSWGLKSLYVTGTKLSNGSLKVFSLETDPNMSIVDAIRITMSFPFGFEPVLYGGEYYADGGIADNFPMNIFNVHSFQSHGLNQSGVNPCTLGFLVDTPEEINLRWGIDATNNIDFSLVKFIESLLNGIHSRLELIRDTYAVQVIQINDLGIPTMDLSLDDVTKTELIESGKIPTQFYFDNYYGQDIVFTHYPDYGDIKEKYYSKGMGELVKLIEVDIWPFLNEVNSIILSIESDKMERRISDLDKALAKFSKATIDIETNKFFAISNMEKTLKKIDMGISHVENSIHDLWIKIKKIKDDLSEVKENTKQHNVLLVEYQTCLSQRESLHLEKKNLCDKYSEIEIKIDRRKKMVNSEVFNILQEKDIVSNIKKMHFDGTLNLLTKNLEAHLDVAIEAVSAYQKNYPDPRCLSDSDVSIAAIVNPLYKKYQSIIKRFNQNDVEYKATLSLNLIGYILKMGLSLRDAESFITIYLSAVQKNMITTTKKEQEIIAKTLYNAFVYSLNKEYNLKDCCETKKIFDDVFFQKANNLGWVSAAQEAQKVASIYVREIFKNKLNETMNDAWKNPDVRSGFSDVLSKLNNKFKSGKWGGEIAFPNYINTCYNKANAVMRGTESFGKHTTNYHVKTIASNGIYASKSSGVNSFSPFSDVKAFVLMPENISLKKITNEPQEIIVIFPSMLSPDQTLSVSSQIIQQREKNFNKIEEEIIQELWWSICQAREVMRVKGTSFKVTIHGESLAAQDAQYFLSSLLKKIRESDNDANDIFNIHLSLVDPLRVNESYARALADDLKKIKNIKKLSGHIVFDVSKGVDGKINKKKETFIGDANILSLLNFSEADVTVDYRDMDYPNKIIFSENNEEKCLADALNESSFFYSKVWVRNIFRFNKGSIAFLNNTFNNKLPYLFSYVANIPIRIMNNNIQNIINPFLILMNRNKQKQCSVLLENRVEASAISTRKKSLPSYPIFNNFNESQPLIEMLIKAGSMENRLKTKMKPPIENLVFEGSGIKGMAYIGALSFMDENNLLTNIKRVAGSSSGGIIAILFAIGYTPIELQQLFLHEINFKALKDQPFSFGGLDSLFNFNGVDISVSKLISLFKNKGFYKGEAFEGLMKDLIGKKLKQKINHMHLQQLSLCELDDIKRGEDRIENDPDKNVEYYLDSKLKEVLERENIKELSLITASQLKKLQKRNPQLNLLDVHVTATNLTNGTLKVFSAESDADLPLYRAARITMSFPGGFVPVLYNGCWYADGGIVNNYPIEIFNQPKYLSHGLNDAGVNPATLGILVDSKDEVSSRWGIKVEPLQTLSLFSLVKNVLYGMHNRTEILRERFNINSIQVSDNVSEEPDYHAASTIDFDLNDAVKRRLIKNGHDALQKYYELYMGADIQYDMVDQFKNLEQKYYKMITTELKYHYKKEVAPLLEQFEVLAPLLIKWSEEHQNNIKAYPLSLNHEIIQDILLKLDNRHYEMQLIQNTLEPQRKVILQEREKKLRQEIQSLEKDLSSYPDHEIKFLQNYIIYQNNLMLIEQAKESCQNLLLERDIMLKAARFKGDILPDLELSQCYALVSKFGESVNHEATNDNDNLLNNKKPLLHAFTQACLEPQNRILAKEEPWGTENTEIIRKPFRENRRQFSMMDR